MRITYKHIKCSWQKWYELWNYLMQSINNDRIMYLHNPDLISILNTQHAFFRSFIYEFTSSAWYLGIVRLGKHLSTVAHVELAIPIARVSLRRCFIFHDLHSFLRHTVEWRKQRRCWRCNIFQAQSGNRLCYKYSAAKARCGSPFIAACICVWCV